jgi:hypothetical protein
VRSWAARSVNILRQQCTAKDVEIMDTSSLAVVFRQFCLDASRRCRASLN